MYISILGLTLLITKGSIFWWLRKYDPTKLTHCTQCLGFWMGFLLNVSSDSLMNALFIGGIVSILGLIVDRLFDWQDAHKNYLYSKTEL